MEINLSLKFEDALSGFCVGSNESRWVGNQISCFRAWTVFIGVIMRSSEISEGIFLALKYVELSM